MGDIVNVMGDLDNILNIHKAIIFYLQMTTYKKSNLLIFLPASYCFVPDDVEHLKTTFAVAEDVVALGLAELGDDVAALVEAEFAEVDSDYGHVVAVAAGGIFGALAVGTDGEPQARQDVSVDVLLREVVLQQIVVLV